MVLSRPLVERLWPGQSGLGKQVYLGGKVPLTVVGVVRYLARPSIGDDAIAAPLAMGALSLIGLVSALAGDGLADWLSWVALAAPALTVVWAMRRRRT